MCKRRERWKHEEAIDKFVRFCAWEATEHAPVCSGYYLLVCGRVGWEHGGNRAGQILFEISLPR